MSNALGLVVDALPGLVWSTDPAGGLDFINQRWHDYTGLDLAQARGQGWQLAIHPEDLPHMLSIWGGIIASGDAGELEARLRRSDGVYRWFLFRACPVLDASGAMIKWCGINTDIEERKRMEQALRASERELYQLIDSVPGMVAVADAAGELEYASKRTLDYADSTFEQLSSRALLDAIHPEERESVTQEWLRCRDVGEAMELDHRLRRFDGVYRWFHVRAEPFRDEHGRIVRWYGLRTDIDDQRRAEEALSVARAELAHVARITSLGALTASIAHEVNQPLSGIITNAGTCLRMLGVDPPNVEGARETARRTIRDGNRAAAVIDRLRAMFSKKKLMKESVDLNEAAREVIALSLSELQRGGVIVRAELDDDLPPITGDRVQLQQVNSESRPERVRRNEYRRRQAKAAGSKN